MPRRVLIRDWIQQPQGQTGLNWANPLTSKLLGRARLAAFRSLGWANPCTGGGTAASPVIVGTVADSTSRFGYGQSTATGGKNGRSYATPNTALQTGSICFFIQFSALSGIQVIAGNDENNNGGIRVQTTGANLELVHVGVAVQAVLASAFVVGVPYFVGIACNDAGDTVRYVVRDLSSGTLRTGSAADANGWVAPVDGKFTVGFGRSTTNSTGCVLDGLVISDHDLSMGELAALGSNPWQLFEPFERSMSWAASGSTVVSVTGLQTDSALGTVVATGKALVPVTGLQTDSALGTIVVTAGIAVPVTGVQTTSALGTVVATGKALVPVTGVETTSVLGTVTATGKALVPVTGLQTTSALGSVVVSLGTTVNLTGVTATAAVGNVVVPSGPIVVSGVFSTTALGNVSVVTVGWSPIVPNVPGNWQPVDEAQNPGWSAVNDSQNPNWQ